MVRATCSHLDVPSERYDNQEPELSKAEQISVFAASSGWMPAPQQRGTEPIRERDDDTSHRGSSRTVAPRAIMGVATARK